jgi:hypothetical protein
VGSGRLNALLEKGWITDLSNETPVTEIGRGGGPRPTRPRSKSLISQKATWDQSRCTCRSGHNWSAIATEPLCPSCASSDQRGPRARR